jgi:threonine/homoserine/homoserine lactone efflux protein
MDGLEKKPPEQQGAGGPSSCGSCSVNMDMIKGWVAVVIGIIFVLSAFKVILSVLSLLCGFLLVYYGLVVLRFDKVTSYVNDKTRMFWNFLHK